MPSWTTRLPNMVNHYAPETPANTDTSVVHFKFSGLDGPPTKKLRTGRESLPSTRTVTRNLNFPE